MPAEAKPGRVTARFSSEGPDAFGGPGGAGTQRRDLSLLIGPPETRAGNDPCAVRVLRAWLEAAGIHRGPVFRRMRRGAIVSTQQLTVQSVALIVKRRSKAAGPGPEQLSGQALRAGY